MSGPGGREDGGASRRATGAPPPVRGAATAATAAPSGPGAWSRLARGRWARRAGRVRPGPVTAPHAGPDAAPATVPGRAPAAVPGRASARRPGRDAGQVAVEFVGMLPVILLTLAVLWQLVLVGYTYTLAGNAADEAVRAGTAASREAREGACGDAGRDKLPSAWRGGSDVKCATGGGRVTARVELRVPVLFPGAGGPLTVRGHAGAVEEVDD
ncbi:pilus assembly protein [Streptomyces sp. SID8352]|nr:pilus assembly protein [Streptomyces sp. SID8352]